MMIGWEDFKDGTWCDRNSRVQMSDIGAVSEEHIGEDHLMGKDSIHRL